MQSERRKLAALGGGGRPRTHFDDVSSTPTIANNGTATDRENMPAYINRMANSSVSTATNEGRDRYHFMGESKSGNNTISSGALNGIKGVTKQSREMLQTATQRTVTLTSSSGRYPSLIDSDSPAERNVRETGLYRRFEEAFEKTLQSNPGLLPGSSPVAKTIKSALYKMQKARADRESELRRQLERERDENSESSHEKMLTEMRRQLDAAKTKNGQREAEMRREMATTAMKHSELNKAIVEAKSDRDRIQAALREELQAIQSMNSDLHAQLKATTSEKEHLSHHLNQLSRTRVELERSVASEVKKVEADKHMLEQLTVERKAVANEIALERQRLRNARAENKKFEAKIENLTVATAREKEALKREIAEIELLEKHTGDLRRQNQASRVELESEQGQLKEVAAAMEAKKTTLRDSRREMEEQYNREIEELEKSLTRTSKDMENEKASRVMKFVRQSGARSQVHNDGDSHRSGSKRDPSRERGRSRYDETDDAYSDVRDSAQHVVQNALQEESATEDILEKELGRLQDELNTLKRMSSPGKPARKVENARSDHDTLRDQRILRRSKSAVESREDDNGIREELRCLREELKSFTSPGRSPGPSRTARRPRTPSHTHDEFPQSRIEDEWRDDEILDRRRLDLRSKSFDRRADYLTPLYRTTPIRRYGVDRRRHDEHIRQPMYYV